MGEWWFRWSHHGDSGSGGATSSGSSTRSPVDTVATSIRAGRSDSGPCSPAERSLPSTPMVMASISSRCRCGMGARLGARAGPESFLHLPAYVHPSAASTRLHGGTPMSLAAKIATGGILAFIGLLVLKMVIGLVGMLAGVLAVAVKIALVVFVIWLVMRLFRRPRDELAW